MKNRGLRRHYTKRWKIHKKIVDTYKYGKAWCGSRYCSFCKHSYNYKEDLKKALKEIERMDIYEVLIDGDFVLEQ